MIDADIKAMPLVQQACIMSGGIAQMLMENPELCRFRTKNAPSERRVRKAFPGMPGSLVKAFRLLAVDQHQFFDAFLRGYWGACHLYGKDWSQPNEFWGYCESRGMRCAKVGEDMFSFACFPAPQPGWVTTWATIAKNLGMLGEKPAVTRH